ncbi:hypothetical protein [Formosa sp. A9]|uniref:hypothetical protein n=1 Tax=Formosa sp. A9 TaxID=3442641 RepID=UPI003EBB919B
MKKKANFFNVYGGSYLLDNYSPATAYSIARRLSATHANPMTIRNGVTNDTLLCQWDSNNELDIPHIENWLGSDYATVDVIYDASGNGRHLNAVGFGGNIATDGVVNVTSAGYPYIVETVNSGNNFATSGFSIAGGDMNLFLLVVGANTIADSADNAIFGIAPFDGQSGSGVRRIQSLTNENNTNHGIRTFNGATVFNTSIYEGTNYKLDTVYHIQGNSGFIGKVNGDLLTETSDSITSINLNTSSRIQVLSVTSNNGKATGRFTEGIVFLTDIEAQLSDLESNIITYYNL